MTDPHFANIKACVFDAYGTLFDVHSAVGSMKSRVGDQAISLSTLWRAKQLEYTWLRSLMGRYDDFWQVTGEALDYALAAHSIEDNSLRRALMEAYLGLDCYPEVPAVLGALNRAGIPCLILSNGSPSMLEDAVRNAGLSDLIQETLSVDALGCYKPDPRVYQLALNTLGVEPTAISFQSSNGWDGVGAAAFGFNVAWINRFGQQREHLPDAGKPIALTDLTQLLPLLGLSGLD